MKKIIATAATAIALTGGTLFATTAPALAQRDGSCNAGDVCLWSEWDKVGKFADYSGDLWNYGSVKFVGSTLGLNNEVGTLGNHGRTSYVKVYDGAGRVGESHIYANNSIDYRVWKNANGYDLNNKISGHDWV